MDSSTEDQEARKTALDIYVDDDEALDQEEVSTNRTLTYDKGRRSEISDIEAASFAEHSVREGVSHDWLLL
jgi:hypothetical protein